jgi:uncharacterized protein
MKFSPADQREGFGIQSYGPGRVVIKGEIHRSSLLVMPDRVVPHWRPACIAELEAGDLAQLAAYQPEIVILGTGKRQHFPPPAIYRKLAEQGIGLEVMNTGAACRTYNILMAEDRRVLAALILIEAGLPSGP